LLNAEQTRLVDAIVTGMSETVASTQSPSKLLAHAGCPPDKKRRSSFQHLLEQQLHLQTELVDEHDRIVASLQAEISELRSALADRVKASIVSTESGGSASQLSLEVDVPKRSDTTFTSDTSRDPDMCAENSEHQATLPGTCNDLRDSDVSETEVATCKTEKDGLPVLLSHERNNGHRIKQPRSSSKYNTAPARSSSSLEKSESPGKRRDGSTSSASLLELPKTPRRKTRSCTNFDSMPVVPIHRHSRCSTESNLDLPRLSDEFHGDSEESGLQPSTDNQGFRLWPILERIWKGDGDEGSERSGTLLMSSQLNFRHPVAMSGMSDGSHIAYPFLQLLVLHPSSPKRMIWVSLGMVFVTYDVLTMPLIVFNLGETLFSISMTFITTIFWTCDIPCCFLVGYHDKASNVESRLVKTAWRYTSTWLTFDLVLILIDWFTLAVQVLFGGDGFADNLPIGRVLRSGRFLRSLRLLRVIRMPRPAQHIQCFIGRSEYTSLILGVFSHMFCILLINHYIACAWCLLGGRDGGWVEVYVKGAYTPMLYFTSLHWSLTQFTPATMAVQPQNFHERVFAVAVLLFAMVTFSSFVSSITDLMTHMRNLRSVETKNFMKLDRYLKDTCISLNLSVRIRRYLEHVLADQQRNLQ